MQGYEPPLFHDKAFFCLWKSYESPGHRRHLDPLGEKMAKV